MRVLAHLVADGPFGSSLVLDGPSFSAKGCVPVISSVPGRLRMMLDAKHVSALLGFLISKGSVCPGTMIHRSRQTPYTHVGFTLLPKHVNLPLVVVVG